MKPWEALVGMHRMGDIALDAFGRKMVEEAEIYLNKDDIEEAERVLKAVPPMYYRDVIAHQMEEDALFKELAERVVAGLIFHGKIPWGFGGNEAAEA